MTDAKATIAELDDEEGKVYALGLNLDAISERDLDDLLDLLDRRFEEAGWMVFGFPIEGSVEISEMDPADVEEIIDTHNLDPEDVYG